MAGNATILIINNALYTKTTKINRIPPIMLSMHGWQVDECPKFLSPSPTIENQSIYLPTDYFRIPLELHGTISYITTRKPSKREYENTSYIVKLTSELLAWDPHSSSYVSQERSIMTPSGDIHEHRLMDMAIFSVIAKLNTEEEINLVTPSELDKVLSGVSPTISPTTFTIAMINLSNTHSILSSLTSKRRPFTFANDLSSNWRIGKEVASNTLQVTTQSDIRTIINPTLEG